MALLNQTQLEDVIRYHRYLYYEKSESMISDYEFDRLFVELGKRFPDSVVYTDETECPRELHNKYERRYLNHLESIEERKKIKYT